MANKALRASLALRRFFQTRFKPQFLLSLHDRTAHENIPRAVSMKLSCPQGFYSARRAQSHKARALWQALKQSKQEQKT